MWMQTERSPVCSEEAVKLKSTMQKILCTAPAALLLLCGCGNGTSAAVQSAGQSAAESSQAEQVTIAEDGVKLSGDSSDFVLLSEAVPDAILEIRYYSTYNSSATGSTAMRSRLRCSQRKRPLRSKLSAMH